MYDIRVKGTEKIHWVISLIVLRIWNRGESVINVNTHKVEANSFTVSKFIWPRAISVYY